MTSPGLAAFSAACRSPPVRTLSVAARPAVAVARKKTTHVGHIPVAGIRNRITGLLGFERDSVGCVQWPSNANASSALTWVFRDRANSLTNSGPRFQRYVGQSR